MIAERQAGDSALSAEDIRAAAAARGELGPEFSDAVVASFPEKVEEQIAARVEVRLADAAPPEASADQDSRRTLLKGIAIGIGIGGFAAAAAGGNPEERLHRLVWVLLVLAVICAIGAARAGRLPGSRRGSGGQRLGAAAVPGQNRRGSGW